MDVQAWARGAVARGSKINWRYWLTAAVVAVAYIVTAKLGLSLAHKAPEQVTVVWPPSGIAFVTILVLGYRYWPSIFVGAFVANILTNEPAWVAGGIALGNTLEALAAAFLLKRFTDFKGAFVKPQHAIGFSLAAAVSTLVAATIGTVCLVAGGLANGAHFGPVALTWWQGDLMGDLVFGSFLLVYLNRSAFEVLRGRAGEAAMLLAAVMAASILIFTIHPAVAISLPYLIFPLMVWAAARFTQLGVATGCLVVAAVAILATISDQGPFASHGGDVEQALLHLQLFVSVLIATSLALAMAISQRMAAEAALTRQAAKLKRLDEELKEANKRVTKILAGILEDGGKHASRNGRGGQE